MMKKAIVMGASSGMGREIALLLLETGWQIGVAARRVEPLEEIRKKAPHLVWVQQIDVNAEEAPRQLQALAEQMGGVDLYVHSSGIGKKNPALEPSVELATVQTNALGFTRMVGTVFRLMAEADGGHIAVISSIAGTRGLGPAPAYSATKAFQNTYIQALEQLAHSRHLPITFTDVRPGFVDTPLLSGGHYPMLMNVHTVSRSIVSAILAHRHVAVVDGRYRVLTFFWRLVPGFIWRRLRL